MINTRIHLLATVVAFLSLVQRTYSQDFILSTSRGYYEGTLSVVDGQAQTSLDPIWENEIGWMEDFVALEGTVIWVDYFGQVFMDDIGSGNRVKLSLVLEDDVVCMDLLDNSVYISDFTKFYVYDVRSGETRIFNKPIDNSHLQFRIYQDSIFMAEGNQLFKSDLKGEGLELVGSFVETDGSPANLGEFDISADTIFSISRGSGNFYGSIRGDTLKLLDQYVLLDNSWSITGVEILKGRVFLCGDREVYETDLHVREITPLGFHLWDPHDVVTDGASLYVSRSRAIYSRRLDAQPEPEFVEILNLQDTLFQGYELLGEIDGRFYDQGFTWDAENGYDSHFLTDFSNSRLVDGRFYGLSRGHLFETDDFESLELVLPESLGSIADFAIATHDIIYFHKDPPRFGDPRVIVKYDRRTLTTSEIFRSVANHSSFIEKMAMQGDQMYAIEDGRGESGHLYMFQMGADTLVSTWNISNHESGYRPDYRMRVRDNYLITYDLRGRDLRVGHIPSSAEDTVHMSPISRQLGDVYGILPVENTVPTRDLNRSDLRKLVLTNPVSERLQILSELPAVPYRFEVRELSSGRTMMSGLLQSEIIRVVALPTGSFALILQPVKSGPAFLGKFIKVDVR